MIPTFITVMHTADGKEPLDADTGNIMRCAGKHRRLLSALCWRPLKEPNMILPCGGAKPVARRPQTPESPFWAAVTSLRVRLKNHVCQLGIAYMRLCFGKGEGQFHGEDRKSESATSDV